MGIIRNYNGKNICFYYYGQDHLAVNLFKYIKKSLERNLHVYLYIDNEISKMLEKSLTKNELNMISYVKLDSELLKTKDCTLKRYVDIMSKLKKEAMDTGYFGATLVIDSSCLIKSIRASMFSDFITSLSDICSDVKMDIFICYDFVDYIGRGKYITEDIMKQSYKSHNFRLYSSEIIPVENFIFNDEAGGRLKAK